VNLKATTSEWIEVKNSKVHGLGVYAAKDIPKGTNVIEYVGRLISKKEADDLSDVHIEMGMSNPEHGMVYIFELNKKYDIDGNVEWNTARFINHSCDPNCETSGDEDHIWIEAMRDVKKGEELNYNYGYDIEDYDEHPCKCGSKKCVGYILDEKLWTKLRKKMKIKKVKEKMKERSGSLIRSPKRGRPREMKTKDSSSR
jgi:uncharacterized protein